MVLVIKVNGSTVISNNTIEDTDVSDAVIGMEVRAWWLDFVARHPSVMHVEVEET